MSELSTRQELQRRASPQAGCARYESATGGPGGARTSETGAAPPAPRTAATSATRPSTPSGPPRAAFLAKNPAAAPASGMPPHPATRNTSPRSRSLLCSGYSRSTPAWSSIRSSAAGPRSSPPTSSAGRVMRPRCRRRSRRCAWSGWRRWECSRGARGEDRGGVRTSRQSFAHYSESTSNPAPLDDVVVVVRA